MHKARKLSAIPPLAPPLDVALDGLFARLGEDRPKVIGAIRGNTSTCFVLDGERERLVLKVYASRSGPYSNVAAEYEALERVWLEARDHPVVSVPRPVELLEEHGAVVMSFIEGEDIDLFMGRGLFPAVGIDALAAGIIAGLRLYHGALGGPFGDCYPGNFLVKSTYEIGMIDPHLPDSEAAKDEVPGASLSVDLAYWAAAVALAVPKEIRVARRLPFNRMRLTWRMIALASLTVPAEYRADFRRRTYATARRDAAQWLHTGNAIGKTKAALTTGILRFMESRSR